ncbi:MAG: single-stranded DNA-binding protein [Bacteroidaceae bacterium]|nr:single-stranded DNA-binding protein [Bacteroidaceae bacterium]
MSINKVILIGHVGNEPRVFEKAETLIVQLSLATTEKGYTLQNGTQVPDRTEWHNIVLWRRVAEIARKYVHKGDKIYIEGKLRTRSYDDEKSGQKKFVTEIVADVIEMLTPKQIPQQGVQQSYQAQPQQQVASQQGIYPQAQPQQQQAPQQGYVPTAQPQQVVQPQQQQAQVYDNPFAPPQAPPFSPNGDGLPF